MSVEKQWFALYTKSRAEKKVGQELQMKGIEAYLPLEKILKQWSDRKKWVEEPLFRSYIFIHADEIGLQSALNTKGVVAVVRFEGKAATIPESQINTIKEILGSGESFDLTQEEFEPGEIIEITQGKLKGLHGELVHHVNKTKILIRINSINQNLLVHIHPSFVKKEV